MLLASNTRQMIRETILQIDPDAKVFLFGSRTDDMAKGGDIDLLILSIIFTTRDLRKLKIHLEDRLRRQKIDLILSPPELTTPFTQGAYENGVLL